MDYKQYNDYELTYMISEDEDSFNLLYEKYQLLINKIVNKFYSSLKQYGVDYDDIKQEADIAFFNTIRQYKDNNLLYTFISISIKNKLLNYSKSVTRMKNYINSDAVSIFQNISDDSKTILLDILENSSSLVPDEVYYNFDLEYNLYKYIFVLSNPDSYIYELILNGFSRSEIASLLDLKPNYISNILYKIRKSLKKYLNSI